MSILYILLLIFILGVIILIHELGHFFFAKKFKVHIYEFSIGMGPVIYTKKGKDGIDYNLRAIPIGGFVSMAGEVYEDADGKEISKKDYMCNKKWHERVLILIAGVINNYLLAIILLFFIGLIGGGNITVPVVDYTQEGYPAELAGFEKNDRILEINGHKVTTWDNAQIILAYEDKDGIYEFLVEKADSKKEEVLKVEPKEVDGVNVFGIGIKIEKYNGFLESIEYAFVKFGNIVSSMLLTLGALFTGKIGVNALAGPIGMYTVVETVASTGIANILYLVAFLSINVGILNILPFPAFDGGRVLFLLIEKIKGSPINQKLENTIHVIGFGLLMLLSIYVAFNDVIRLIFK